MEAAFLVPPRLLLCRRVVEAIVILLLLLLPQHGRLPRDGYPKASGPVIGRVSRATTKLI